MKDKVLLLSFLALVFFCRSTLAQEEAGKQLKASKETAIQTSAELKAIIDESIAEALAKFGPGGLAPENIAATLIDMKPASGPKAGAYRGDAKIYPASVIKLFYLAATHQWLKEGRIRDSKELRRAMRDMIVDSSNDATHQIVDVLTEATGGGELPQKKLAAWAEKRNAINRFFRALGYSDINACQKTYCDDIYGRERQFWDEGKNRNMLTTDSTARLLAEIVMEKSVSADASREMLALLKRDPYQQNANRDDQSTGFSGLALKDEKDARLWSKAGWTSNARHDAAYIETSDGLKFIVCIFTEKAANERGLIEAVVKKTIAGMRKKANPAK